MTPPFKCTVYEPKLFLSGKFTNQQIPFVTKSFQILPAQTLLTVNPDASRHYVVAKSEKEGIENLRNQTQTSLVEEEWVFVEGMDPHGVPQSLWYETGENENSISISTPSLTEYYKNLAAVIQDTRGKGIQITRWAVYHIHPYFPDRHLPTMKCNPKTHQVFPLTSLVSDADYSSFYGLAYGVSEKLAEPLSPPEVGVVSFYGAWKLFWIQPPPDQKIIDEELNHRSWLIGSMNSMGFDLANQCAVSSEACNPNYSVFENLMETNHAKAIYTPFSLAPADSTVTSCKTSTSADKN